MRDRLIELIKQVPYGVSVGAKFTQQFSEKMADNLLANGVIVPPCKVGDTVYYIEGAYYKSKRQTVTPIKVTEISWKCDKTTKTLLIGL